MKKFLIIFLLVGFISTRIAKDNQCTSIDCIGGLSYDGTNQQCEYN